ncbi:MAG TPA: DUF2004 domain-containing protein [Candidatus Lumbricidophila sp.]|nr:DUF2004 domain-containing protein [Candidatus Lumbricidophila sp.]
MAEHDYFGAIDGYWDDVIEYGDQRVEVSVECDDEPAPRALDAAADLLRGLEWLDEELREHLVGELGRGGAVVEFVNAVLDPEHESSEEITDAIGRDSGDREIDLLRSLELLRVEIRPESDGDGEHFAELEYAIAPNDTDERLLVVVDLDRAPVEVRFDG